MQQQVGTARLDQEGLIEICGAGRIERDEAPRRAIDMLGGLALCREVRGHEHVRGESVGHLKIAADRRQAAGERVGGINECLHGRSPRSP